MSPGAPFRNGQTLTVIRRTRDAYGDYTSRSTHAVPGCAVTRRSTLETTEGGARATVVTRLWVYAPPGSDVVPSDLVELPDGTRWNVDGDARTYASPFTGWAPAHRFALVRATG